MQKKSYFKSRIYRPFSVRTSPEKDVRFSIALDYQHTFCFVGLLGTEVFDFCLVLISQIVKS